MPHARFHGEVAEDSKFSEASAIFKRHGGFGFARAYGIEEVDENGFGAGQGLGRGRRLPQFLVGNDVHHVAVGAGENHPFITHVERAAVARIECFVRVLLAQFK
jgi:hypothetical protein